MDLEKVLAHIADALKWPVLVLAVVALVVVIAEVGALVVELVVRRRRPLTLLEAHLATALSGLATGSGAGAAKAALEPVATDRAMAGVVDQILETVTGPDAHDPDVLAERVSKQLAEYDFSRLRRLERTRMLVRFGPALGLMGTLIPLAPALAGLADGDVKTLSDNLQVAFSVTVTGLLIGALAFAVSLIRDRLYAQDFSDVQYLAARLTLPPARPAGAGAHTGGVPVAAEAPDTVR